MNEKSLGKIIKMGRMKKGIAQNKLAEILGVTKVSVWAWETGKSIPDGKTLMQLALELDIVEELFPGYIKQEIQKEKQEDYSLAEIARRLAEVEKRVGIHISQVNNHQAVVNGIKG